MDSVDYRQRTIREEVSCTGIGLHSGHPVNMTIKPAPPDHGIAFIRKDIPSHPVIKAQFDSVVDTNLSTTIGNNGFKVSTVEHLMAAFFGLGIENVRVELDGPEVPIMDGSAEPFVFLIECAGTEEQKAPRRAIRILKPVIAHIGSAVAKLSPASDFSMKVVIDFDNPAIGAQAFNLDVTSEVFKAEISRARTFGFLEDVEALRKAGLALGGSLENAIVVSGDRILNDGGLRYQDEFVRHKVLDCIGDLYLAGGPIIGCFSGHRAGHSVNNRLLRAVFADSSAWTYTTVDEVRPIQTDRWVETPAVAVA